MRFCSKFLTLSLILCITNTYAQDNTAIELKINALEQQTKQLQKQLQHLKTESMKKSSKHKEDDKNNNSSTQPKSFHASAVNIHTLNKHSKIMGFYPTALEAENQVITYIAGTPVITSPYLGARPAFDGSDYIVNISSINRDIRLMQQRQKLYQAYQAIGYPLPKIPIIALSGKVEPAASVNQPFNKAYVDLDLGSSELDIATILNDKVEAFISIAYDSSPPALGGPRVSNSAFNLNMGFVNIGDLAQTPFYFTAGQLFVPFGRYSSSMISASLPLQLARTKSRPIILGYKSQENSGTYAAVYGFHSDTGYEHSGIGGINIGYIFAGNKLSGEVGISFISSITDSGGMQITNSIPLTTFGGFGSITNGSEHISKVPAVDIHGNVSFDRYNITAEWVGVTEDFQPQYLSFNGKGASPQATQLEAGMTFKAFTKPASVAIGYQWSEQTLALNLPKNRLLGVFNISIWRDTVESLQYSHDKDFSTTQYANGISALDSINVNTLGTGKSSNNLTAQIGVYF